MKNTNAFSRNTAISVVVANMIGTGVFTSLGFQLLDITVPWVILLLWAVGGAIALSGALCYAELAAALPRSGGEYHFLSSLVHPGVGFVSGWISATIGFAAPTALAAMTFGHYLAAAFPEASVRGLALALLLTVTVAHVFSRQVSGRFQVAFTTLKLLLIGAFCVAVALAPTPLQPLSWTPAVEDLSLLFSGGFAVSLIYVSYAYTGWNAATYLTSEIQNPQRTLPQVLVVGTAIVMVLYLALNTAFLYGAPIPLLRGEEEVGYLVATHLFGTQAGIVMSVVLALLLISTASAMILAGPRVLQTIGQDFPALKVLAQTNRHNVPVIAILFQTAISTVLILTATFDAILVFTGFTLALNSMATVASLFILRKRSQPRPFHTPLFPLPPIVFLLLTGWTMAFLVSERPEEVLWSAVIVVTGALFYLATRSLSRY